MDHFLFKAKRKRAEREFIVVLSLIQVKRAALSVAEFFISKNIFKKKITEKEKKIII